MFEINYPEVVSAFAGLLSGAILGASIGTHTEETLRRFHGMYPPSSTLKVTVYGSAKVF